MLLNEDLNQVDSRLTRNLTQLNTRVDNIVAQAGDDNTEIVDARVGIDGKTYTTTVTLKREQPNL